MKLKGRTARVMSMKLISRNGNPCFQIKFIGPDGNVLSEPKPIDMGPGGNVSQQKLIYKNFEKHLAVYDKVRASELVQKLENNIKQGKIKTDSDIYSFIKRNIPDKKLARAVTEELGERPPRGFLAKARGLRIAQAGGIIANAASVTGLIIAGDILHGQFDRNTLIKASLFAGGAAAAAVTMHYGTEYLSKKLAEKILQQEGKKVSQKVINQLARTMTKSMGSAFVIGTEIYALWSYSRAYQTGNLSQEDFLVYSGLTTLGAAGSLAAILAGSSSVLGPVGFIIGATTAAAILWYSHYQETKKQERLEKEELFRAKWEITNDEEKFREAIEKMEKEAETQRLNAWKKLLTASIP